MLLVLPTVSSIFYLLFFYASFRLGGEQKAKMKAARAEAESPVCIGTYVAILRLPTYLYYFMYVQASFFIFPLFDVHHDTKSLLLSWEGSAIKGGQGRPKPRLGKRRSGKIIRRR